MSRTKFLAGAAFVGVLAACGSSSSGGGQPGSGAPANAVTQTGRIVDFAVCGESITPVAGAAITIGSSSTTTASDGTYSIPVPSDAPFTMQVVKTTDPSYVPLLEEENTVKAAYARGDTKLISTTTATLLSSALPSYDSTLALISVELVKTGACTDLGGATVTATPTGPKALTQYPASCASPVGMNAFVTDGIFPAAVVYNVTPGTQSLTAASPKCTQIPFPYTDPTTGLTYDGTVESQGGLGTSFVRIFMQ